ncbi:hypothetical protein HNQ07_004284 [Deinococcus metalli]|uniref:Uncharacterized protein n=1 Tax=Deinococcus metalli TaxID=1141878 RepID=A0A7W8KIG1_9DEIO|nr:hypothetical protein [Deinococcus metalli]MBB5378777.1 hypothetical protein [Deinococcus metalli]GHF60801.1 hypothetical protein GCM10017781_41330 [Deinococcus metalli]
MMHVDQRPRLLFMIGLALIAASLMTGYSDAAEAWTRLFKSIQEQYHARYGVQLEPLNYISDCVTKASCRRAYMNAWGVPWWELLLLHTNAVLGLTFVGYSRFWRPEQWFYRRARVDSGRMDEWRDKSSRQPKDTLRVVRPKE